MCLLTEQTHIGIKGVVTDTSNKVISGAEIKVTDLQTGKPIDHDILSCKYCLSKNDHNILLL